MMWASFGLTPLVECRRESLEVDSVWLDRDRRERGAALAQREQRAVVARSFDDHLVTGGDQLVEQERVGLHRAFVTSTCASSTPWRSAIQRRNGR